jgi:hypothetical protein
MTYKATAEDLERMAESKRREEAFPNVGYEEGQDRTECQWGIRNKKTGEVIKVNSDLLRMYGPMGSMKLPETHEIVMRILWPRPWEAYPW